MPIQFPGRFTTIKWGLIGALSLLIALFAVPASLSVWESHQRHGKMARLTGMVQTGIDFFQAVRNLGYERGRTNVVLTHMGPLPEMAQNREFVAQRRQEGEEALSRAMVAAQTQEPGRFAAILEDLRAAREDVERLRVKADKEMVLPGAERDRQLPPVWFATATKQIKLVRQLLEEYCVEISRIDGESASIAQLMLTSLALRDDAAPEIAIMTGIMASGRPMEQDVYLRILTSRGQVLQVWEQMRQAALFLGSETVTKRINRFRELYFDIYMPVGVRMLELARQGGPYPMAPMDFLAMGVDAVESLVGAMAAIAEVGAEHAGQILEEARERLVLRATLLGLGLLVAVNILLLVTWRLINPLTRLIQSTHHIAGRELELEVPYRDRRDEIGALARAVEVLKGNTTTMIRDMAALEESRANLQKALDEVDTLSGLLPICASCKKIRDDKGYWQAIEKYIGQRSQARFSHSVCPDCVRKLYPELADKILGDLQDPSIKD